jgi:hypothetical protein
MLIKHLNKVDQEFRSGLGKLIAPDDHDSADYDEEAEGDLHNHLMDLIEQGKVSSHVVLQTFVDLLGKYPDRWGLLVLTMGAVVRTGEMFETYHFPELFWLAVQSKDPQTIKDFDSFARDLGGLTNPATFRSYFVGLMIAEDDEARLKKMVIALYYVGYTVELLRIVRAYFPLDDENLDIYPFIYSDVMGFVHSPRAENLSDDDKTYLKAFFEQGLKLPDERIVESSRKALDKIA